MTFIQILIGILLAGLSLWSIQRYQAQTRKWLISIWLLIAALIYVGFGLRASDGNWLLTELGGVVVYGTLAFLGWKRSAWFLVVGWSAHGLWDAALHSGPEIWFVPKWYAGACLGFDLLVAAYAAFVLTQTAKE